MKNVDQIHISGIIFRTLLYGLHSISFPNTVKNVKTYDRTIAFFPQVTLIVIGDFNVI